MVGRFSRDVKVEEMCSTAVWSVACGTMAVEVEVELWKVKIGGLRLKLGPP